MEDIYIPTHVTTTFFTENAVLLDSRRNKYYSLNGSASGFWKFLTQMGSFEAALEEVLKLYQGSSDTIAEDMENLVVELLKIGLLEKAH